MAPAHAVCLGLLASAPVALLAVDSGRRICAWNLAAVELLGWGAAEVVNEPLELVFPSGIGELPPGSGAAASHGVVARRRDGSCLGVRVDLSDFTAPGGPFVAVAVCESAPPRDMNVERQHFRLEQLSELTREFAHDVNNQLGIVLNYSWLLAKKLEDATSVTALSDVRAAAERAVALTRQLVILASRAAGDEGPVELTALFRELEPLIVDTLGPPARARLALPRRPLFVEVEARQIEQIVLNLVANAREAMPAGGVLSIDVTETATAGPTDSAAVSLSFADTGRGIPPEVLGQLFEPSYTTKTGDGAAGLGLATVRQIAGLYSGRVTVESELGVGTTIEVILPCSPGALTHA